MCKNVICTIEKPVYLWTHTAWLRDWYERHGFVPINTIENYAEHPVICIMQKNTHNQTSKSVNLHNSVC